jgi:hypothetical protein
LAEDRVRSDKLTAIVAPLRLALSRNMARALVTRGSDSIASDDGRSER